MIAPPGATVSFSRQFRLIQAKLRSTTHRFGKTTKRWRSEPLKQHKAQMTKFSGINISARVNSILGKRQPPLARKSDANATKFNA
jgi:hypothetical protein